MNLEKIITKIERTETLSDFFDNVHPGFCGHIIKYGWMPGNTDITIYCYGALVHTPDLKSKFESMFYNAGNLYPELVTRLKKIKEIFSITTTPFIGISQEGEPGIHSFSLMIKHKDI